MVAPSGATLAQAPPPSARLTDHVIVVSIDGKTDFDSVDHATLRELLSQRVGMR